MCTLLGLLRDMRKSDSLASSHCGGSVTIYMLLILSMKAKYGTPK